VQATSVLQALKAFKQLDTMKVSPSSGLPFDDEEDSASGVRQHGERGYYSKAGMHEEKEVVARVLARTDTYSYKSSCANIAR